MMKVTKIAKVKERRTCPETKVTLRKVMENLVKIS
jgi:hypothetical protein